MAFKQGSFAKEVSTAAFSGTGAITLGGVPSGDDDAKTFVSIIGDGNSCEYIAKGSNGQWQRSRGTVTAGSPDQLSRDTVIANSLGTKAQIDYATGTLDVYAVNPLAPPPRLYAVSGLVPANGDGAGGGDQDHDMTFTAGVLSTVDGLDYELPASLTKQADADFAKGDDSGGRGTGVTLPATGAVYWFLIAETSTGDVDIYMDTASAGTNVPSGWTVIGEIARFMTDGSNNFHGFAARELAGGALEIVYKTKPTANFSSSVANGARTLIALDGAPPEVEVEVRGNVLHTTSNGNMVLTAPGQETDEAVSATVAPLADATFTANTPTHFRRRIMLNASRQVGARTDVATNATVRCAPLGYRLERRAA